MRRREFITLLGGATAAWPVAARAQQPTGTRRIGVLMNFRSDTAEGQARIAAFMQALQELGWNEGNVRTDVRWAADDPERYRKYSEELVGLNPDAILASASPSVAALQRITRSVPVVFANIVDPVGAGYVTSLARPGGNVTGFTAFEYSIGGKWLELLKQIAPRVTRIAVLRDPAIAAGIGQFAAIQSAASSPAVELSVIDPRDAGELGRALDTFAREPNGGLIVTASTSATAHHELINSLALRHRMPAIHAFRYSILSGGLASYGPNTIDVYRRAATYVDRILKGAKPSELPVQAPNKYELVINLKIAKTLGLEIPPTLLATADEIIE